MLPTIRVLTFGTLQVIRGDHHVTEGDWHTRQARQLLKILITERPRPVSTDRLIEILWPQSTPDAAATTLRSAINALRNVLEPERPNRAPSRYIITQTPGYAFHLLPEIWLDVDAFEHKLTAAQHITGQSPAELAQRLQMLEEAVALYQDDYLVSDPYADWAEAERERLRERCFMALLQLAELQAMGGDYAAAISSTRRILARDEVRENAYQALMRYQAESGDSAGALLSYERCRTILADELGADPSPLTQLWHQRILNGEVTARETDLLHSTVHALGHAATPALHAATVAATPPTPSELPALQLLPSVDVRYLGALVGREREFAQLRSLAEAALGGHAAPGGHGAAGGHGVLVFLEGEAGVGKTRLAVSVLQHAAEAGATVISAGCQAIERNLPFSPLAESLGRYLHRMPNEALPLLPYASLAQMGQIVPSLYDRIPGLPQPPPEPTATPDENRQRLIDGIVAFLATLSRLRPLALFIDDLHWADADTLAVISRLTQRLADLPILLLLAYRSDDLAENEALSTLLHALRRKGSGQMVEVTRFDRSQVQQYVEALMGRDHAFDGELARLLFDSTQGNPLFVTETLRDLLERHPELGGEAETGAPAEHEPPALATAHEPAPHDEAWSSHLRALLTSRRTQRVHDLILERIERLPDRALWVLQLSAVIARDYSLELLETAATEDPLEGLETLLQRKFLIERPDLRLDFSHQTVRQVAYESMSALQRRRWHLRVADALVKIHRAERNPAETAFHYSQAGQTGRLAQARYSVAAGEQLLGAYAFRQAIDYFDRALDALSHVHEAPPALTERALLGRGLAHESLFDLDGVTDSYRLLLNHARAHHDRSLLLKTHSRMATVLGLMGQDRESNELLQELLGVLGRPNEEEAIQSHVLTDLLNRRATIYSAEATPQPPAVGEGAPPALPAAGRNTAGANGNQHSAQAAGGEWAAFTAPPPAVRDPEADLLQVLEPIHAVLPLLDYGWTLLVQGQLGEATACLSAVVDLASETGQLSIASTALHQLAVTARILGDIEQSQRLNDQSVELNRKAPGAASELASMWPRIASALLSLQLGRLDEAERRLRRVLDFLGPRDTYRNYRNSANIGLGLVHLARGERVQAHTLLAGALVDPVNLYPYMHVRALLGLARIARMEGDSAGADALLRRTLRFAGRRSLLDEYIETVLEIAAERPSGAPIEQLIDATLAYVRPVGFDSAARRLEAARSALAGAPAAPSAPLPTIA